MLVAGGSLAGWAGPPAPRSVALASAPADVAGETAAPAWPADLAAPAAPLEAVEAADLVEPVEHVGETAGDVETADEGVAGRVDETDQGAQGRKPRAARVPAATPTPVPTPVATPAGYRFGTLLTDHRRAAEEYRAGVRVVHLEIGWDNYEPREGVFNEAYIAETKARLRAMQAAGMQVVLGVGLQYPPAWVFGYPGSRYVNQHGVAAGPVNLTFNQPLRARAERYIARVHQDLGLEHFVAVRIGSGGLIESLYPGMHDGTHDNSYWAYDVNAQGGAGRPASVPAAPFPGWKPGERTYRGRAFTTAEVAQWYDWYLRAMVDGIAWQIATYTRLGYTGDLQVLLPGLGSRPREHAAALAAYLDGTGDPNRTMGRAAVWHKVLEALPDRQRVVVYVSSVADGSGGNDLCQASDAGVALDSPLVERWSATRWLSYLAGGHGLATNGENPGRGDTRSYGAGMLDAAARQMHACGFQGLMWAHDANLYDGTSGVTLADYGRVIARY